MKIYQGTIKGQRTTADEHVVEVVANGQTRPLAHYSHHSRYWSWGYEGSGPAALAYDILCDHFGERPTLDAVYAGSPTAQAVYQDFKRRFIATIPQADNLRITEYAIALWLAVPAQQARLARHRAQWTDLIGPDATPGLINLRGAQVQGSIQIGNVAGGDQVIITTTEQARIKHTEK